MIDSEPTGRDRIGETFRNGSVTGVGLLAGFSLTFLTAWSASPIPWKPDDVLVPVPLIIGVGLELWSLVALLDPDSLLPTRHRRATRSFIAGLILVGIGVAAARAIDIAALSEGA
ncbi:MAG TPA: hypothetical protein VFK86_17860 [Bauldia sp.]|nr:hypothetical protein [Bauldia sp.]